MRKLVETLTAQLNAFIAGRDALVLLARCRPADAMPLQKMIEGVEEGSTADLFWVWPEAFENARAYVDALSASFLAKHMAVRAAMPGAGLVPWPETPAALFESGRDPVERLRDLMTFSRGLLPAAEGCCAVWAFLPAAVADRAAAATFFAQLVEHRVPFPWCHHLRIILRDEAGGPLDKALAGRPRVATVAVDFGPAAMEKSLAAETADESLPLPARMNALVTLAGLDIGANRLSDARDKFALAHSYYDATGNSTLAALALNGLGTVSMMRNDLDRAADHFEAALPAVSTGESPPLPLFLTVAQNLAIVRAKQQRWDEAAGYYGVTEQLASLVRSPGTKLQALEQKGLMEQHAGKLDEAVKTWADAADIADKLDEPVALRSLLVRLRDHHAKHGPRERLDEIQTRLAALPPAPPSANGHRH